MIGKTISHYRILEKLGGGAMGVVYKASDTLLDRHVALKVISPDLVGDQEAVSAFIREAKAASALNHPGILTVHDLVHAEGSQFIVMELVEGHTLRHVIGKKGLELKQLLNIATEVGEALATAHRAGIVHRDLKPENIMVRNDGLVKVVDFGLAKLLVRKEALGLGAGPMESTFPLRGTPDQRPETPQEHSHIAGTLPYMSPEQLSGQAVDHRTDIFSFGVVLYEMASGQQPFQGRTTGEIIDSILQKQPQPITDLSRVVPDKLQDVVSKCLEKDSDERYQHMEDVVVDLRRIKRVTDSGKPFPTPTPPPPRGTLGEWLRRHSRIVFGLLSALVLAAIVTVIVKWPPTLGGPVLVASWGDDVGDASMSPDGINIAFDSDKSGQREIYVTMTTGGPARRVTEGIGDKYDPRFSPDGTQVLYIREDENTELWKVPTNGGTPQKVLSNVASADWTRDGPRVVYVGQPADEHPFVGIADEAGQNSSKSFDLPFREIDHVRCSPDGKWIFFNGDGRARLATSKGSPITDLEDKVPAHLGGVEWSEDSRFLFFSKTENGIANIWRLRLADRTVKRVTTGEGADCDPMPLTDRTALFYANGRLQKSLWKVTMKNKEASELIGGGWFSAPMMSPDKKEVAYLEEEPGILGTGSIRVVGIDGENDRTIPTNGRCYNIAWAPDSRRLAFSAAPEPKRPTHYNLFVHSLDDNRTCQVTFGPADDYVDDWSPDGKEILFTRDSGKEDSMTTLRLPEGEDCAKSGGSESVVAEDLEGLEFSRDGRWILALGSEYTPANMGLWILPARGEDGKKKRRILSEPVTEPRWALGQRAIVYSLVGGHRGRVELWKLPVTDGQPDGPPTLLYSFRTRKSGRDEWDITDDLSILVYPRSQVQMSFYKRVLPRWPLFGLHSLFP